MEVELHKWYQQQARNKVPVTAKAIKLKAIELTSNQDFIASKGWLDKFKVRYGLQLAKEKQSSSETYETVSADDYSDDSESDYEEDDIVAVA